MSDVPHITATCREYLATGTPVRTMTNAELSEQLHTTSVDPIALDRVMDLNQRFGGLRLPAADPRPTIFCTIGIPTQARLDLERDVSIPFFDFGVAAPCSVEILPTGAVVADFANDLPPIEAAASFEVFLEGLAREWLAPQRFEHFGGRELAGTTSELQATLVADGRVAEASDDWTTWWQTDDYLAELSSMWDYYRTPRLHVWHNGRPPEPFAQFLAG